MTEYDYSPEAYEAYLATQAKISRWVDKTNRMYPYLGNPFTPATPAVHGSELPPQQERDAYRSSSKKGKDREKQIGRDGNYDRRKDIDGVWGGERDMDRDRDMNQDKNRVKDRDRYRDRGSGRDSFESHSGSRSRSHSRPPPTRSKSTPLASSKAPHSRRASYDQYAYDRPSENKYHSSKYDSGISIHSRHASQSKPDLSSSSNIRYASPTRYDSDVIPTSSTRKHFQSSSATHLPKSHLPPSRHRASASTHHLPTPTSAPPLTSHFQYPPNPPRKEPTRSLTLPPDDRSRGSPWLTPQPPPPPPPPVIPPGGFYGAPKGQGYYYPRGTGYPNDRRVIPPPPPVIPAPEPGHGHGSHANARGRKMEVCGSLSIVYNRC